MLQSRRFLQDGTVGLQGVIHGNYPLVFVPLMTKEISTLFVKAGSASGIQAIILQGNEVAGCFFSCCRRIANGKATSVAKVIPVDTFS